MIKKIFCLLTLVGTLGAFGQSESDELVAYSESPDWNCKMVSLSTLPFSNSEIGKSKNVGVMRVKCVSDVFRSANTYWLSCDAEAGGGYPDITECARRSKDRTSSTWMPFEGSPVTSSAEDDSTCKYMTSVPWILYRDTDKPGKYDATCLTPQDGVGCKTKFAACLPSDKNGQPTSDGALAVSCRSNKLCNQDPIRMKPAQTSAMLEQLQARGQGGASVEASASSAGGGHQRR